MTAPVGVVSAATSPPDARIALLCWALWVVGAALSRSVGLWLGVGVSAFALGALVALVEGPSLRSMIRFDARSVAAGVGAGAAMTAATFALFGPVLRAVPGLAGEVAALHATFGEPSWVRVGLLLPGAIVGEELVWRGVVHSALARRVGPVFAVPVGASVYAAAHAPVGALTLVLACVGCGLCWGALRAATRGLVAPLIAHLMWDFAVLVVWPLGA